MERNPEQLRIPHQICLWIIILCYLSLFAMATISSIYLLRTAMQEPPVSVVVFFKYILLALVFSLLFLRAFFALSLRIDRLKAFSSATHNFKWLFGIAAILVIAANLGFFDKTAGKNIHIPVEQLFILILLCLFAAGSDWFLYRILPAPEEPEEHIEERQHSSGS